MKCSGGFRWIDDESFETEDCNKEAIYLGCEGYCCEKHKCRCAKPIDLVLKKESISLPTNLVARIIVNLRGLNLEDLADEVQFSIDGKDYYDGHRCRLCEKLVGGDSKHKCW